METQWTSFSLSKGEQKNRAWNTLKIVAVQVLEQKNEAVVIGSRIVTLGVLISTQRKFLP